MTGWRKRGAGKKNTMTTQTKVRSTAEALKLALEAYIKAGIGNSTDFVLQGKAYDLAVEALAQPEPSPEWMTEEEQTAYTFGWFKALESKRRAQPEQRSVSEHLEPVAFVVKQYVGHGRPSIKGNGFDGLEIGYTREEADEFIAWVNAYINTSPQRTAEQSSRTLAWVGLTDEEREQMVDMVIADKKTKDQIGDLQRMVEAKLKEKNT